MEKGDNYRKKKIDERLRLQREKGKLKRRGKGNDKNKKGGERYGIY